jgi:hypothetical protein
LASWASFSPLLHQHADIYACKPFKEKYPCNPSWEIARSLPAYLPDKVTPSDSPSSGATVKPSPEPKHPHARPKENAALEEHTPPNKADPQLPPVRILVHPDAIRVNYQIVRKLVPSLWNKNRGRKIDLMIHLGMAGSERAYSLEKKAHRDGYKHPDVDNEKLNDDARRKDEGSKWIWYGTPEELETDIDVYDVVDRWRSSFPVSLSRLFQLVSPLNRG